MSGKKVIDVWLADLTFPHYMDRLWRLGEAFDRAHPEYHVNIEGRDFRTLPVQVAEASAQGRPPAIAEYYFSVTQAARDTLGADGRPQFTSVQQAIAGRTEILGEPVVIDDIIPAVREYYSYDGDLTSMPSAATTSLLYANRRFLDAAGIDRLPRTWDEVAAVCAAVAGLPDGPGHRITWANHGTFFQQAVAVQGGTFSDRDNGRSGRATRVDLASPEMLAWVEWWQRLHREGHYLYTGRIPDWEGTLRAFAEQRVALRVTSSNDVNYMVQSARQHGFDIEVGRFPYRSDVPYGGNAIAGTSLWLADGLDDDIRDGALAFLQFMHNPRNEADRHKANSSIPITHSAFRLLEQEGWFEDHPYHRVASDQLNSYPPEVAGSTLDAPPSRGALFGDFCGAQDAMTRAMGDVLTTGADPVDRFARATAETQRMLEEYERDRLAPGPLRPRSLRVEHFTDAEAYSGADLENVVRLGR